MTFPPEIPSKFPPQIWYTKTKTYVWCISVPPHLQLKMKTGFKNTVEHSSNSCQIFTAVHSSTHTFWNHKQLATVHNLVTLYLSAPRLKAGRRLQRLRKDVWEHSILPSDNNCLVTFCAVRYWRSRIFSFFSGDFPAFKTLHSIERLIFKSSIKMHNKTGWVVLVN